MCNVCVYEEKMKVARVGWLEHVYVLLKMDEGD